MLDERGPVGVAAFDHAAFVQSPYVVSLGVIVEVEFAIVDVPELCIRVGDLVVRGRPRTVTSALWGIFRRIRSEEVAIDGRREQPIGTVPSF